MMLRGKIEHFDTAKMKEAENPFCLIRLSIFLFSFDVEDPFSNGFSLLLSVKANTARHFSVCLTLCPCEGDGF